MTDNWPRWFQFGFFSVAAALVVGFAGELLKLSNIGMVLQLGALAPTLFTNSLNLTLINLIAFAVVSWFLVGAFLGKFVEKSSIAALLWWTFLITGSWISFLIFKYS